MAKFRNETKGARAIRLRDRSSILVDAGQESEVIADGAIVAWHPDLIRIETGGARIINDRASSLEALTDDELASFFEKCYGKRPHHKMKRETIVERLLADRE